MWWGALVLLLLCMCHGAAARIEVSVSWDTLSSEDQPPPPMHQLAMSSIGDSIFLFGGLMGNQTGPAVNSLHVFSTKSETWEDLSVPDGADVPSARSGHGMEVILGETTTQLVVFGGVDSTGALLNDLFVFDVPTKAWRRPPQESPPLARYLHGTAEAGGLFFVLGGRLSVSEDALAATGLDLYDVGSQRWEKVGAGAGGPSRRFGHGMAGLGNDVYVFGGASGGPAQGRVVFNDLYAFYYGPDEWENLGLAAGGTAPAPRVLPGMVASGNALYIFGGFANLGDEESLRGLHIFDIQEGRWVAFEAACDGFPAPFAAAVFAGQSLAVLGNTLLVYGTVPAHAQPSLFTAELQVIGMEVLPGDAAAHPARVNHGMAVVDDTVYVYGGSLDLLGGTTFDDMYRYHVPSRQWQNMIAPAAGRLPTLRFLHGMVAVGQTLWIHGGGSYVAGHVCMPTPAALADLHSFNTLTNVWTEYNLPVDGQVPAAARTTGASPLARWGHGMVAVETKLYIFGGYSQTTAGNSTHPECARAYLNDLHAFDTTTRTWTDLSVPSFGNVPETRAMGGLAESDGKLFVFGGLTHFANVHHNDLHSYQITTQRWTDLSTPAFGTPPSPRAWFPMGIAQGTLGQNTGTSGEVIYVIGGYRRVPNQDNDPFIFFDLHAYDIKTHSWAEIEFPCANFPRPPTRLHQHMAIAGNILYMFGGTESATGPGGPLMHALLVCPSANCDIALPSAAPPPAAFAGVLFQAQLAYSAAAFANLTTQARYLAAVAQAAQVPADQVGVTRVREVGAPAAAAARRLLAAAVLVDTRVVLSDAAAARTAAERLSAQLKVELEAAGLAYQSLAIAPQVVADAAQEFASPQDAPDTTTPTPEPEADDGGGGGLGAGALAGIVVGAIVGVGALVGGGWLLWSRRQSKLEDLRRAQVNTGTEMPTRAGSNGAPPAPMEAESSTAQTSKV